MSNTRNWPHIAAHSMTIGGKHTFADWSMLPTEIPVFAPPVPKTTYLDIPGANGALDYTDELTGKVYYENRTGSFSFIVLPDEEWQDIYSTVLNFLHGKRLNCILDDDPDYFYTGRFSVNEWKSNRNYSTIVIDYTVEPYKQAVDSTAEHDWLWDDLFDVTIYYGTFTVSGTKTRNLVNPGADVLTPKFTVSSPMVVAFNGMYYTLDTGTTTNPGFTLAPGDNTMTFTGTGTVLVDYSVGKIL